MTVADLIEKLKELPPELRVVTVTESDYPEIDGAYVARVWVIGESDEAEVVIVD